jgi:large exoprotein involved in heme utilization and adhesion
MRPDLPGTENSSSSPVDIKPTRSASKQIVEAQGWVINDDGKVELVAVAPQATLSQQTPVACDSQSEKVAQN